ncbi:Membrane-bound lytic murein transglycosylase C [Pandoraea capi]|uniref:Membrane-bound lytic murein transglycosylase C n=1 Tax=Pandoraea capi TaxID=2508286 RepID=A0ABY6W3Q1_9BURK|nr:transglycosylase SLT domain-containing protein [Pandoraea capi]VVE23046.1 Membrane-bound lytic murein transglycosylase C [Pandoraea capi]
MSAPSMLSLHRVWRIVVLVSAALMLSGLPTRAADLGLLPHHPRLADAQIAVPVVSALARGASVELRATQGGEATLSEAAGDSSRDGKRALPDDPREAARRLVSSFREPDVETPVAIASPRSLPDGEVNSRGRGASDGATGGLIDAPGNVSISTSVAAQSTTLTSAESQPSATLPFDTLVRRAAYASSVDAALLHAIIDTESGYDPQAVSERGAIGLMQVLPRTGQRFGVRRLEDPAENVRAGASYVRWLLSRFDGDVSLALAAYNAGEGAVLRYGRQVPPYPETQKYVRKVMAGYSRLREAGVAEGAVVAGVAGTPHAHGMPGAAGGPANTARAYAPASTSSRSPLATAVRGDGVAGMASAKDGDGIRGTANGAVTSAGKKADNRTESVKTPSAADQKADRAWRLLRGLGALITRSPSADAARPAGHAARDRDQPAVVMPSRVRERVTGAALGPAGRDARASALPG